MGFPFPRNIARQHHVAAFVALQKSVSPVISQFWAATTGFIVAAAPIHLRFSARDTVWFNVTLFKPSHFFKDSHSVESDLGLLVLPRQAFSVQCAKSAFHLGFLLGGDLHFCQSNRARMPADFLQSLERYKRHFAVCADFWFNPFFHTECLSFQKLSAAGIVRSYEGVIHKPVILRFWRVETACFSRFQGAIETKNTVSTT